MSTKTLLALLLILSAFTSKAQNTVIKAGHLFDARTGRMLDNQTIIIQDGKIKEVWNKSESQQNR
jgi:imidazolonepropionase-like amidohydrolase